MEQISDISEYDIIAEDIVDAVLDMSDDAEVKCYE